MKTKRIAIIMLCAVLCVVMGGEKILSALFLPTCAAESEAVVEYTNAYNDLILMHNFNPDDYSIKVGSDTDYYSLELITIAEGVNGELFVYVYQPSAKSDIRASHITLGFYNRSSSSEDLNIKDILKSEVHTLTYLNNYGQFFKYKVDDFKVSTEDVRSYELTDLLRPFNKDFGDVEPGAENTISAVSYPVGKFFTFTGTSGERSSLSVEDIEYITVENKFVGYIEVEQDAYLYDAAIHLHFVAFSTDIPIDRLIEAYVFYETQEYHDTWTSAGHKEYWGEIEDHYITIDDNSTIEFEVSDGFVTKESFELIDQILPTSKFLNQHITISRFPGFSTSEKIVFGEEERAELKKTDWVLTFAKTAEEDNTSANGDTFYSVTRVGNVKLLRLKFETDDKIYNLGVVDNMQTGSNNPSAVVEEEEWFQKLVLLIIVMICMLAIYIFLDIYVPWLAKIIRWVAGAFWWLFTSLLKLLWWLVSTLLNIITAPFQAFFDNASRKVKKTLNIRSPRRSRGRSGKSRSSRNSRFWQKTVEDLTSSVKTSIEKGKAALRDKAKRK